MALANIPQSGQTLGVTRDPIRLNFQTIDTAFSVDHAAYGAGNQGQHRHVTMPDLAANYTPGVGLTAIYSQNNATTMQNEIYITNAAGTTKPLTAFSNAGGANNGWYYAPSGHLIKYGSASITAGTSVTVNTASFGPAFSAAMYNVQVTPQLASTVNLVVFQVTNPTAPGAFTINATLPNGGAPGTIGFYYQVIGY